jgi:hypothetical protein
MLAMLELLEEKYGGVGAYCRNYLGLLDSVRIYIGYHIPTS